MNNQLDLCCDLQDALNHLPTVELGLYPTALQHMPRYGQMLGHEELYIKRDDMTGLGIGGNKTRSLEFLLGEALEKQATIIIAGGSIQSNLCALTAAACARLGLDCILVHNSNAPDEPTGNALLNRLCGAQSIFIGEVDEAQRAAHMRQVAEGIRRNGRTPYIIENSSATTEGALGYVSGALELTQQCHEQGKEIDHVAIPGAMAGTSSGLVAGAALLGHPFDVHVINVEYPGDTLGNLIEKFTEGVFDALNMQPVTPVEQVMEIHHDFLGEGYGKPTERAMRALRNLARREGIYSEVIYTSKTLAGLTSLIRSGLIPPGETACFWHTGGIGALFAQGDMILGGEPGS